MAVRASDSRVYGHYEVLVTVEPVDEPPEFQSGSKDSFTYRENGIYALYTYRATDPEGADVGWSVSGADAGHFAISNSGVCPSAIRPTLRTRSASTETFTTRSTR